MDPISLVNLPLDGAGQFIIESLAYAHRFSQFQVHEELGYARGRTIAVNPVNPLPHKTRFHEVAHVLLGHTAEGEQHDGELTPRNLRECEAESVALLCCAALELPGIEYSRGYIQAWWGKGNPIPEKSAQRILKVADQILRAGREQSAADDQGVA